MSNNGFVVPVPNIQKNEEKSLLEVQIQVHHTQDHVKITPVGLNCPPINPTVEIKDVCTPNRQTLLPSFKELLRDLNENINCEKNKTLY
jgi:hypothetical protein